MTLILKQIFNFIKLLNSETGTNQIASAVVCGMILGFSPAFSLQSVIVFTCLFLFRIQMGAAFGTAFFFSVLAFLLDPLFHSVGVYFLELEGLKAFYTVLYNMPVIPFTHFNNSITMGAGVIALILAIPVFFLSKVLIIKYREKILERFKDTKFWKLVKATGFYKWYVKYEQIRG